MKKLYIFYLLITGSVLLINCSQISHIDFDFELTPFRQNEKWGYIDSKSNIKINSQFKKAYNFTEGLAFVQNQDSLWGVIGNSGKYIISPQFMGALPFSEGLALVFKKDHPLMYINKKGEIEFTLKSIEKASSFRNGLAVFARKDENNQLRYGYIDKTGKIIINPQFKFAYSFVGEYAFTRDYSTGKLGIINKEGVLVVNPQFDEARQFRNGLAAVFDGYKWGYIDIHGKYAINPEYSSCGDFTEKIAPVKIGNDWGFINKNGKFAINPQFKYASNFHNGFALISFDLKQYGYIQADGTIAINPQFQYGFPFYKKHAFVKSNNKFGTINKEGRYEINPFIESIYMDYDRQENHLPLFLKSQENTLTNEESPSETKAKILDKFSLSEMGYKFFKPGYFRDNESGEKLKISDTEIIYRNPKGKEIKMNVHSISGNDVTVFFSQNIDNKYFLTFAKNKIICKDQGNNIQVFSEISERSYRFDY